MEVSYADSLCIGVANLEGLYNLVTCAREGHQYCNSSMIGISTPENKAPAWRRDTHQTLDEKPFNLLGQILKIFRRSDDVYPPNIIVDIRR
ncbi:hypothetical protein Bca4012_061137 [Brassica carinata]